MVDSYATDEITPWPKLVFRGTVVRRAVVIALIVGTVLAIINHGDFMLEGTLGEGSIKKILLTYLVPYCISTYSSASAIRTQQRLASAKKVRT